ncbi:ubiquinone biosynthesis protein COQ9, mitochondrial isoform X2 [Daktulosphaira vitifoliae]|uniref:ubiquinone biosynthesis protein COQ9, mitochondrial isoform X2 n=1 Tax=Daktulosphaira vitifoliae TaxID=58002 RepID=UPI0021AAE1C0|nr:ubiquinone biosynthesis protein COQ9, mitochondrial isoform X2 [Daktulosphaira vitifoliae]
MLLTMFCRTLPKANLHTKVNSLFSVCLYLKDVVGSRSYNNNEKPIDKDIHQDISNDDEYENNIKHKIMLSSLPFVPTHGWTKETVCAGAGELGYPDTIHGLFTDPGADLALYFYTMSNKKLAQLLQNGELKCSGQDKKELVNFLTSTIQTRLLMIHPYLKQWPQAMALLSKPSNAPRTLYNLMTLVDDICFYAGERSIDTTWYTRRIGLGTIYKTSELHLLQDSSPGYRDTWNFLKKIVEECVKYDTMLQSNAQLAKDVVNASVLTAKNILGFTWNR